MSKKLCFIVTDAISFNVLYRGQLEYLADEGYDLTLICGGTTSEIHKLQARNVGKVIDYGFVRKPSIWLDLLSLMKLLSHFFSNRYDVVVSTTPKALLLGSITSFLTFQPRRVSFFQGRVYENVKGLKRKFYVLLDRIILACSHESIFVSKSLMTEFVKDIPNVCRKGLVIGNGSGNGVCATKFSPARMSESKIIETCSNLGIKNSEFIILIVGRICKDKGVNEIVEVVNLVSGQVSNVHFVMLGNVEDDLMFNHFSQLRAEGFITHIDFVDDITPYFCIADMHLFLSHREGFGNVAIEAAAMNVPTIAFDVVGVKDSVADGVSGLRFKLGDSKSVANKILEYVKDPESMKKHFKNSREWAIKNFEQKRVWQNYLKFYLKGI